MRAVIVAIVVGVVALLFGQEPILAQVPSPKTTEPPSASAPEDNAGSADDDSSLGDSPTQPVSEQQPKSGEAPGADKSEGVVQYAEVDAATHRVFAVGNVDLVVVEADGVDVALAIPKAGHGTGFAVGQDGLVVTAGHVVDDALHLVIRMPGDGGFLPAQLAYRDEEQDVAVLWVADPLVPLRMADVADRLRVRQTVFAIGYPLDATRTQAQSARGIVAGQIDEDVLQLDISLNPGNSGGPLVNEKDEVVGMVVARGNVKSGVQGLGFAIAAPRIRRALEKAKARIGKGTLSAPTPSQTISAEVVDELLRLGALHAVRENQDLTQGFSETNLEQEIVKLARRVSDPHILVFLAGSMWNGGQVLVHGEVRQIGETTLTDKEAIKIGNQLRQAAIDLVARAYGLDKGVVTKSEFANFIRNHYPRDPDSLDKPSVVVNDDQPEREYERGRIGYVNAQFLARLNLDSGTKAFGAGADAGIFLNSPKRLDPPTVFGILGGSVGRVQLTSEIDGREIFHTYYAVELGVGLSSPLGASSRVELSLSVMPGKYKTAVESETRFIDDQESGLLLGHFRAGANFDNGRIRVGFGFHYIGRTSFWLEPLRLGVRF